MRHGEITPTTAAQTIPVVYVDLPWGGDTAVEDALAGFPGLMSRTISDGDPDTGTSTVRVEGPLPQLLRWARVQLVTDDVVTDLAPRLYLAR